jgi:hypothetical protein
MPMSGIRQSLIVAIHECRVVQLRYEGSPWSRTVHPHVLFRTSTDKECVDAYQVSGPTHGGPLPGWRQFDLDKVVSLAIAAETFATAPGYDPEAAKYRHGITARV